MHLHRVLRFLILLCAAYNLAAQKEYFGDEKALIRVDFNVPLDKATFAITDDTRMTAAVPTITKILNDGGSVILMSHLGRPKDGPEEKSSLKHITQHLSDLLGGKPVLFANDCIGTQANELAANLKAGEVLLLENLRFYKEEEKGDVAFAEKLSKHGDIYVNDAFGTAHRAHASTAVIAQFFAADAKCFGYVMAGEVASIDKVINGAEAPFTAIVGGAKVSDKILIIEQLMNKANNILIGGGMAFTFVKAMGGTIGKSLCEDDKLELAKELLAKAKARGVNLYIPTDAIVADNFANDAAKKDSKINIKVINNCSNRDQKGKSGWNLLLKCQSREIGSCEKELHELADLLKKEVEILKKILDHYELERQCYIAYGDKIWEILIDSNYIQMDNRPVGQSLCQTLDFECEQKMNEQRQLDFNNIREQKNKNRQPSSVTNSKEFTIKRI